MLRPLLPPAILLTALASGCAAPPGADEHSPNVVLVLVDDMGWGDLGSQGAEGFATPRLDRMAAEGMRRTSFYSAGPVCTPSRAGLLTGRYPRRMGLGHRVLFPFSEHALPHEERTLAEVLSDHGYATACIGKWHLGHRPEDLPPRHGFDRWFGVPYSNDMDGHYYAGRDFQSPPLPLWDQDTVVEEAPDQRFLTRRFTDQAIAFAEAHRDRPFFLYLAHVMPHLPISASPEFEGRSELGLYGDVIQEIDHSVGRLLDALDALPDGRETLVVFLSDNGPWRPASSGPLRGKKNTTWEGGQRVPCVVRMPGAIQPGIVSDVPASMLDLFPIVADLTGATLPDAPFVDGRGSFREFADPPTAGADDRASLLDPGAAFYFYRDDRLQAVRAGRWKLHVHRPRAGEAGTGIELYDLAADPGEADDRADAEPEVVATLQAFADAARRSIGDAVTGTAGDGRPLPSRLP